MVRHRVRRLLIRRGLEPGDEVTGPTDRLAEECPLLAGIVRALAQVWVSADDQAGLERLCRYVVRPPLAQERLRLRGDVVKLKMARHDGMTEPVELPPCGPAFARRRSARAD